MRVGAPLDERPIGSAPYRASRASAPAALSRARVSQPFATGIRSIDALATVGQGQRVGVFSPAGEHTAGAGKQLVQRCDFGAELVEFTCIGEFVGELVVVFEPPVPHEGRDLFRCRLAEPVHRPEAVFLDPSRNRSKSGREHASGNVSSMTTGFPTEKPLSVSNVSSTFPVSGYK